MDAACRQTGNEENPPRHEAPAEDLGNHFGPASAVQIFRQSLPGRFTPHGCGSALRCPQRCRVFHGPRLVAWAVTRDSDGIRSASTGLIFRVPEKPNAEGTSESESMR